MWVNVNILQTNGGAYQEKRRHLRGRSCWETIPGEEELKMLKLVSILVWNRLFLKVIVESTTLAARLSNRLLMALARWSKLVIQEKTTRVWSQIMFFQGVRELGGRQSEETGSCWHHITNEFISSLVVFKWFWDILPEMYCVIFGATYISHDVFVCFCSESFAS